MRFFWLITCFTLLVVPAQADLLTVLNPGFEDDFAAPGTFPLLVPSEWTLIDPGNITSGGSDFVGVLNPTGTLLFPGGAPDGDNVALIFLLTDRGTTEVGLGQVLSSTLLANTSYTLSVQVGNIASTTLNLDGFPGYRIELLAGGVVLAANDDVLTPGSIAEGEFELREVNFTTGLAHAQLGLDLEIRLYSRNQIESVANPGIEVNFDSVQLDATAVPEPSSIFLLAIATICFSIGKFRNREV